MSNIIRTTGRELLMKNVNMMPFLLEPFLPQVGMACIAGGSDTGKSAFLRQLAMAITSGMSSCFDMKLNPKFNRVIYVSTEDDELATSYLIQRQNRSLHLESHQLTNLEFWFAYNDLISELDAKLAMSKVDLIVLDCFSDLYYGGMNDSSQVREFLNHFARLSAQYQCLIIFLHHCGKRTENMLPSKHNLLGSQAFEAKMRLVLELRNDISDSRYKHLCCVKGNYLSSNLKNKSIKLQFNDDLIFTDTGYRVPYYQLIDNNEIQDTKYEAIIGLRQQGLTYEEIANKVGFKDKSGVSKFLKRYDSKKTD